MLRIACEMTTWCPVVTIGCHKVLSDATYCMRNNHLMGRQELYVWWWARTIEMIWEALIPLGSAGLLLYGGWQVLDEYLMPGFLPVIMDSTTLAFRVTHPAAPLHKKAKVRGVNVCVCAIFVCPSIWFLVCGRHVGVMPIMSPQDDVVNSVWTVRVVPASPSLQTSYCRYSSKCFVSRSHHVSRTNA